MSTTETTEPQQLIAAMTGQYVLGNEAQKPGVNLFACRLKSISATGYVVVAPVVGDVSDSITASFAPFGTLRGSIVRHLPDGFAVDLATTTAERDNLRVKIDAFRNRLWTGETDMRGEPRYMPGEPRSVVVLPNGDYRPCLIVDFSASGAAVSAEVNPAPGTRVTIGQVPGTVVRGFDLGFAVQFETLQRADEIEGMLEAPREWQDAVSILPTNHIDTTGPGEMTDGYGYD